MSIVCVRKQRETSPFISTNYIIILFLCKVMAILCHSNQLSISTDLLTYSFDIST